MPLEDDVLGKRPAEFAHAFGLTRLKPPPPTAEGEPRYLEFPDRGVSIVLDESDVAICVQLWSEGRSDEYQGYGGPLPKGLTFGSSRDVVRATLGKPVKSENGGPGKGLFGGVLLPWDLFRSEGRDIHFEYSDSGVDIRLVSISLPSVVITSGAET